MTVTFAGTSYDCLKAVRDGNSATLYLTEGGTVEFIGIHNWESFSLAGGEWSDPQVTAQEQLRADIDFIAVMTGVDL